MVGVILMSWEGDHSSTHVISILLEISCHVGLWCNDTHLYNASDDLSMVNYNFNHIVHDAEVLISDTNGKPQINDLFIWLQLLKPENSGRIRLSVSTVNRTYELSGKTHVTPFRKYGKHSTGPSTYGLWARTYSKLFSCKPVLMVCSYGAQSNEICTYGRVSRGTIPRVRRYGLLYLRTVEYDHCHCHRWPIYKWQSVGRFIPNNEQKLWVC